MRKTLITCHAGSIRQRRIIISESLTGFESIALHLNKEYHLGVPTRSSCSCILYPSEDGQPVVQSF